MWEQVAESLSWDEVLKAIKNYIVAWNPGQKYRGKKKTYRCGIHASLQGDCCPNLLEWRKNDGDTYDLFGNGNSHATEVHNFVVSYTFTFEHSYMTSYNYISVESDRS